MTNDEARALIAELCPLLAALSDSAAADVAEYTTRRGTPTWDDHRVGRMLARDPVLAGLAPLAAAAATLVAELDHATAHDGDHLSKSSRRMVDTVMGERDALRERVHSLEAEVGRLRNAIGELRTPATDDRIDDILRGEP
jgi:hypothetical protein